MSHVLCLFLFLSCAVWANDEVDSSRPQGKGSVIENGSPIDAVGKNRALGFSSDREALAYALGSDRAQGLLRRFQYLEELGIELDPRMVERGFLDAFAGSASNNGRSGSMRLTVEQVKTLIYAFDREVAAAEQSRARHESSANIERGNQYLSENAKKPGVVTLPSGLQYRVLKKGTGERVGRDDVVVLHYRGHLIDGSEFESSYEQNGHPEMFRVSGVIAGWMEALQMMRVGDQWELTIPPHLAYGASRRGLVPANAVVLYDIQLLEVRVADR